MSLTPKSTGKQADTDTKRTTLFKDLKLKKTF